MSATSFAADVAPAVGDALPVCITTPAIGTENAQQASQEISGILSELYRPGAKGTTPAEMDADMHKIMTGLSPSVVDQVSFWNGSDSLPNSVAGKAAGKKEYYWTDDYAAGGPADWKNYHVAAQPKFDPTFMTPFSYGGEYFDRKKMNEYFAQQGVAPVGVPAQI